MKTVMRFDVTVAILMLIGMPAMAQTPMLCHQRMGRLWMWLRQRHSQSMLT